LEILTTPDSISTNQMTQSIDYKNSTRFEKELFAEILENDSVGAPILIISLAVSLASIFIVQLLFIYYLKQKISVLQEKLNTQFPMNKVAIQQSMQESDEAEDEVNECYGISSEKTTEKNYHEIAL
jgi:hypothetical protein